MKAEYQFFFARDDLISLENRINALVEKGWRIVMTAGDVIIVANPAAQLAGRDESKNDTNLRYGM